MTTQPAGPGFCREARILPIALILIAVGCQTTRPSTRHHFLAKQSRETIRVMTWNIGRDSIFPGTPFARPEQFARVVRAIQPDIVCLQDVFAGARPAALLFDTILPLGSGRTWQHHGIIDNVILSRFDLSLQDAETLELRQRRTPAHAMALARDANRSAYVICGHFQSGAGVAEREQQGDLVSEHVRALRSSGGLPRRTPIVILGDLNSNASFPPTFVASLRSGRIRGLAPAPGQSPDWDGSELEDALPRHNGRGEDVWTWKKEGSEFPPSSMDRVLYTGSVAVAEHSFVLNTTTMTAEELDASGLQRDDGMFRVSERFHDHLPVVVDFRMRK
jgi:endonuclease/exonuclease/phosphatase family metal-dependent hydrolase